MPGEVVCRGNNYTLQSPLLVYYCAQILFSLLNITFSLLINLLL
jgi:hypothetical protein